MIEIPVSKGAQEIFRIPMDATGKIIGDPVPTPATINGDIARVELSTFSALFAVTTPNYHAQLKPGINLAGQCKSLTCIAHHQEVTHHYNDRWDSGSRQFKTHISKCSACDQPFAVENIHLFRCFAEVFESSDPSNSSYIDISDPNKNDVESYKLADVLEISVTQFDSFFSIFFHLASSTLQFPGRGLCRSILPLNSFKL